MRNAAHKVSVRLSEDKTARPTAAQRISYTASAQVTPFGCQKFKDDREVDPADNTQHCLISTTNRKPHHTRKYMLWP
jgi:hypothetical protein